MKMMAKKDSILSDYWVVVARDKDPDLLYTHSLSLLERLIGKSESVIFLWDANESMLIARKIIRSGIVQDGEEKIIVTEGSSLWPLVNGEKDVIIYQKQNVTLCIALRYNNEFIGMLRTEKISGKSFSATEIIKVKKFCAEFSIAYNNLKIYMQNEKHVKQLKALFEISSNIVKSIHLRELLRLIVKSIVNNMGFDRVRLYIINKNNKGKEILKGEISYDIRGEMRDISNEVYPVEFGVHPLVNALLGKEDDSIQKSFHDIVVFIPLQIKDNVVGLMVVDNILSQKKIVDDEMNTVKSFAGQIAMAIENARLFEKVEELSVTDSLTGLYVLRHFKERLKIELYRTRRYGNPFALFLIDVDDFKNINDTYGHPVGDMVLKSISNKIKKILRKTDFACRYGGDEFIACLVNVDEESIKKLAERLLNLVSEMNIYGKRFNIGLSIGISIVPKHANSIERAISIADKALYKAKKKGKNRFVVWGDS